MKLFRGYYLGTGLITVVGTSFSTLSTANAVCISLFHRFRVHSDGNNLWVVQIFDAMYRDGTCPSSTSATGIVTRGSCPDAYGMVLGESYHTVSCSQNKCGILIYRNFVDLFLPGNIHVVCTTSIIAAGVSPNGYWLV